MKLPPYLRDELERLKKFPVTNKIIDFPIFDDDRNFAKLQVEPELAIYADIVYEEDALGRRTVGRGVIFYSGTQNRIIYSGTLHEGTSDRVHNRIFGGNP